MTTRAQVIASILRVGESVRDENNMPWILPYGAEQIANQLIADGIVVLDPLDRPWGAGNGGRRHLYGERKTDAIGKLYAWSLCGSPLRRFDDQGEHTRAVCALDPCQRCLGSVWTTRDQP